MERELRLQRKRRVQRARLLALALLAMSPWLLWLARPARRLRLAVLDKTVANASYREHRGLVWVMNHAKYVREDGSPYLAERDYFGFAPRAAPGRSVRELPTPIPASDILYVADTYGVYSNDLRGDNRSGERSRKVYGGLEESEVARMRDALRAGTTLIAEFNSFASPTGRRTRDAFCKLLGLRWDGWIGRFFVDLKAGREVPEWAVRNFQAQYRQPWKFQGPGYLLVNESDRVIVLEEGRDVGRAGCRVQLTAAGQAAFGLSAAARYNYWFDVVAPEPGTQVLAAYSLPVTPAGGAKLREHGLPASFPAVLHRTTGSGGIYYFAGDYADSDDVPFFYQFYGWDRLKQGFTLDSRQNNRSFYWRIYVPMMEQILADTAAKQAPGGAAPKN